MSARLAEGRGAPARPAAVPRLLLITGGKGGVGKTTLAANLAVELARESRPFTGHASGAEGPSRGPEAPSPLPSDRRKLPTVAGEVPEKRPPLLVDFDLGLADLGVFLRLPEGRGLEGFLEGGEAIEDCLVEGPGGLQVLPAASGAHRLARPDDARRERLLQGLTAVGRRFGLIVGDSPAGIGPDVLHLAARAERVLVVTTPEPAAMTDAYGLVKALDAQARESCVDVPTPELFINLAVDGNEARQVAERLAGVCRRFLARSPRLLGWMPRSRVVLQSVISQTPFVLSQRNSLPAQSVARLARRLSSFSAPARGALLGAAGSQGSVTHDR